MTIKERLYPTEVRLPLWVRPATLRVALSRLRVSDVMVTRISEIFDTRGLLRAALFPDAPPVLNPAEYLDGVREIAPVDGTEVVEWMHISAAENAVLQARAREYNRLGSQLVYANGDPYIPGVHVEDIYYVSQLGSKIRSQGFGIARTPRGDFRVPALGKAVGAFRDLISEGLMSYIGSVQWTGTLLKWKSLAETPITQSVGFFRDLAGNVASNFFVQRPPRPALTVHVRQKFSSNIDQTLTINFRDPTDYSRVLGSRSVAIAAGQCQVEYTVSAFPYVPPLIAEIAPEDNTDTKLDEYIVA